MLGSLDSGDIPLPSNIFWAFLAAAHWNYSEKKGPLILSFTFTALWMRFENFEYSILMKTFQSILSVNSWAEQTRSQIDEIKSK